MRKYIVSLLTVFVFVFWGSLFSTVCAETKTLQDFKNSAFIKKYPQKNQMKSWPLRDGGYDNSLSFRLGNDPDSWFSIDVVTKSANNPIISRFGLMFHDESGVDYKTKFTPKIKDIIRDFISSLDSGWPQKDFLEYVQNQSAIKYSRISDAPRQTFTSLSGKNYYVQVGTVGNSIIVGIDIGQ